MSQPDWETLGDLDRATMLVNIVSAAVTGGNRDDDQYVQLRNNFIRDRSLAQLLPQFIKTSRDLQQIWGYFRTKEPTWAGRRMLIAQGFEPLFEHLESRSAIPLDDHAAEALRSFDPAGVHEVWLKALSRREQDPEGAITTARTLLETVCKTILDRSNIEYGDDDLPKLYHKTAASLQLAPNQMSEEVFRSILGSVQNIVNNIGTLRNRLGDAHGKGRLPVKPGPRHAALAVNLAGAMATFLVETEESRRSP